MAGEKPVRMHGTNVKLQVLVKPEVAEKLQAMADADERSLSNYAALVLAKHCGRRPK